MRTRMAVNKMRVKVKKDIVYTLELTEDEARLLKGMVQNPICENEDKQIYNLRESIWNALSGVRPI